MKTPPRDSTTLHSDDTSAATPAPSRWVPRLTILAHPDPARVGSRLWLEQGPTLQLSRFEPAFDDGRALEDTSISRRPLTLTCSDVGVRVVLGEFSSTVTVAQERQDRPEWLIERRCLESGLPLRLGRRILLWLELDDPGLGDPVPEADFGRSHRARALSARVVRAARMTGDPPAPVLITGPTGSGKELVAKALHRLGDRRRHRFVSVNMAALASGTALSTLFGHVKGAFTGADSASPGLFGHADGGTLFLDEIGAALLDVQDSLLRAVGTDPEVIPVGGVEAKKLRPRIVAATDTDLAAAVSEQRFRRPLLERLSTVRIEVPGLDVRRVDIPRIFLTFLAEELGRVGAADKLNSPDTLWLDAVVMEALVLRSYPGHVRELRNLAVRIASDYADQDVVPVSAVSGPTELRPPGALARAALTAGAVQDALAASDFVMNEAARRLGVPHATLHEFVERTGAAPRAVGLTKDDIERALSGAGGDRTLAARALGVSLRSLQLRLARERRSS